MRLGFANGRMRVRYGYACYGYTRGNGTVWHGGLDVELLDDKTFGMPTFRGKKIRGKVVQARIVTDKSNRTWEWGYYICVKLDANQTPDKVNYLYFCHCSKLLVKVGDVVESGDVLGVMGNSGNASLANPPYEHVHFEVRQTATSKGLNPVDYCDCENKVGTYGSLPNLTEKLIDVSWYQRSIDWKTVPYRAIIRVGYRGYLPEGNLTVDSFFEKNLIGAIENDKLAGFYFFSQAKTADEARAEAEFADKCINGRGKGLPMFFDAEWSSEKNHLGRADSLSKDVRTACARAFCERAKELGYRPGIYTFTNFALSYIDYESIVKSGCIGWLSDTRAAFNTTLPRHIHQYGQEIVNGITSGFVDMNNVVKSYDGSDTTVPTKTMQQITIGPVSNGDALKIYNLAKTLGLTDQGLYKAEYV